MEIERQHSRTTNTTSELYICFTSRLSHSSSMRRSSKSILSPGRNINGDISNRNSTPLTTSLSRRLRKNGSLRGGAQSPALFPSNVTKKNRGSSVFSENPEPSSPKVTCIGQVRVKTKKQGKKMKLRAKFRRVEQKNVSLSICETLKGFGIPCKSSCFSSGNGSNERKGEKGCFRWLVSLEEGGSEGKRRDIELVVGGEDDDDDEIVEEKKGRVIERECSRSRRRSIFDDMEFDDLFTNGNNGNNNNVRNDDIVVSSNVEKGRVSVCVPPKNALLLMRCRSDPIRMASLSQKFLEGSFVQEEVDDDVVKEECFVEVKEEICVQVEEKMMGVKDEEEIVGIEEEICVQVDEDLGVRVEEVVEVKEENDAQFHEEDEIEGEKREEICEDLEVVEDEIDEICENLDGVETKIEDLGAFSEELEQKLEEVEDEKQEETMEEHGVEVSCVKGEEKEDGIENREETGEEQGIKIEIAKENRDETEYKQSSIERNEIEELVLPVVEETRVIESEDFVNGCSIETVVEEKVEESENECLVEAITVEEKKVEEGENSRNMVEMVEEQAMGVQEESKIEESCEIVTKCSSTSCILPEESKELDLKQESIEVEKDVFQEEKQGRRKSMEKEKTKTNPTLPDCLLLMMCEPKLSMEVSKETWISSTDFTRCLPERHHNQKPKNPDSSDDQSSVTSKKAKPAAIAAQPPLLPLCQLAKPGIQPGRSSISFPASGGSMANLIEQKLVKAGVKIGYEPFVLPRCKSAPLRSTAKFGCKLEPHRSATCGVGTAGIGF